MPLASRRKTTRLALVSVSLAALGLDVSVDGASDAVVGAAGFVLVDQRGSFAVVAHPHHGVAEPGPLDAGP